MKVSEKHENSEDAAVRIAESLERLDRTPLTDAPRIHRSRGTLTIGTVIANQVYIPFGGDRIYGVRPKAC